MKRRSRHAARHAHPPPAPAHPWGALGQKLRAGIVELTAPEQSDKDEQQPKPYNTLPS